MSSQVEIKYDQFCSDLEKTLRNIDVNFALRLMYLERKTPLSYIPSVKDPHVVLTIKYKPQTKMDEKKYELRSKFGFEVDSSGDPTEIICLGYMNLGKVIEVSSDPHIVSIKGKASPTIV
ncbi:MAG: hypothetical protein QW177_06990 [Candidatus Nitrosotenuis sp.]